MKVLVIPKKPIPGILPKNKWIDTKMVLDLNKNEIKHCMQFGSVYDENNKLIDSISIKNIPDTISKEKSIEIKEVIINSNTENSIEFNEKQKEDENPNTKNLKEVSNPEEKKEVEHTELEENHVEEDIVQEPYFNLVATYSPEDEYIILSAKMNTNSKLEGNLYGLFSITSGVKPSLIEYKSKDNWVKFSTKFSNFDEVENEDEFIFRIIPNGEEEFAFRILIKETNVELVKLEGKVNPKEL